LCILNFLLFLAFFTTRYIILSFSLKVEVDNDYALLTKRFFYILASCCNDAFFVVSLLGASNQKIYTVEPLLPDICWFYFGYDNFDFLIAKVYQVFI